MSEERVICKPRVMTVREIYSLKQNATNFDPLNIAWVFEFGANNKKINYRQESRLFSA